MGSPTTAGLASCCPRPLTASGLSAKSPQCRTGSASQSPEPCSAAVPPSPKLWGTVTTIRHCAQHGCLLHWEMLLDAASGCSAYIHWLVIDRSKNL